MIQNVILMNESQEISSDSQSDVASMPYVTSLVPVRAWHIYI